jgi:dipeptidase E
MTPTITTATLSGDEPDPAIDEAAMALVSFHFWPHYVAGAEMRPAAERVLKMLPNVYGCPDGSGLVIDGRHTELYGSIRLLGSEQGDA